MITPDHITTADVMSDLFHRVLDDGVVDKRVIRKIHLRNKGRMLSFRQGRRNYNVGVIRID
jgi:hypothetical protein